VVRRLGWLKARLTWNGIRSDRQRRIGFPAVLGLMFWLGWYLSGKLARIHASLPPAEAEQFLLWASLLFFLAWVALPVVIFPLDEGLDPAQLAVFPIPRRRLLTGLAAASLVSPSAAIPLTVIGTNVSLLPGLGGRLFGLVAGAAYLALLAVGAQLFTATVSAILRSRRGRDLAVLLIIGIGLGSFASYQTISGYVDRLGLAAALRTYPLTSLAPALPPVSLQRALVEAGSGDWASAVVMLAVGVAWIGVLGWLWGRLLGWMLVTPDQSPRPEKSRRRRGLAESGPWGVRMVLARKELRFYVRDPRQRLVWTGTVIFVGLAIAVLVVGAESMGSFRQSDWLPLLAPALVLFVGLPIALNQFGWERNAASYLFVLPIRPRHLLHGKNLALLTGLVIETLFLAVLLAVVSGSWRVIHMVPALAVAAIGCQLAVGNLVSVITPLRLPREGTDVFSQASEQGCLAMTMQMTSFFFIGVLLIPPAVAVVLTVSFGQVLSPLTTTIFCTGWGLFFYGASMFLSSWLLRRRVPEVVSWVQVR
jgi:ABC-2 type transport system permease protein